MRSSTTQPRGCGRERGATLYIVAASLVSILAAAGLAIDLVALYVGRSEAQRSADGAALAGARMFSSSTYSTGGVASTSLCPTSATSPPSGLAGNAAVTAGEANRVGNQTLTSSAFTATCDFTHDVVNGISDDPLITVQVTATMPTYFMKIFGYQSMNVAASATAEAFNPTAGSEAFCANCVKPFLVPNCDPGHPVAASDPNANTNCGGTGTGTGTGKTIACAGGTGKCYPSNFINPSTLKVVNPGVCTANNSTCSGGVVGELWQLHTNAAPSQWYELSFDGTQSKSSFENAVQQCSSGTIACGQFIPTMDGKAVGPNGHSVGCLITYGQTCKSQSVTSTDTITVNPASTPPYTIAAGANNPFCPSCTNVTQSASLITVPVYDGHQLTPGKDTAQIVGYMLMFIEDVEHNGTSDDLDVVVLNVSQCGTTQGSCSATGNAAGGGNTFLPVRLVQTP